MPTYEWYDSVYMSFPNAPLLLSEFCAVEQIKPVIDLIAAETVCDV